jgi:hypothetical protein
MVEDLAGIAIEAIGEIGSVVDSSSRRRKRNGCAWFALIGLIVILVTVGVALLTT